MATLVAPLLLGPKNCEAATGLPWRRVRDHAHALGISLVRIGKTTTVPAREYLEAASKALDDSPNAPAPAAVESADALRERLGLRLVGGAK